VPGGNVRAAALLALFWTASGASAGAELQIEYPAIAKVLAQQVFTQDGRKYVRGDKKQRCNFAYLEHPEISGTGGRLGIRAHFTGQSAQNIFGRCVGLGDSFDVQIASTPYFHDGVIGLKDVRVESINKDGVYIRMVRAALAYSLANEFQYRVMDDAKRMLEAPRDPLPIGQELRSFRVTEIRVTGDALVMTLDFTLVVK
jgi:hypothetical protein